MLSRQTEPFDTNHITRVVQRLLGLMMVFAVSITLLQKKGIYIFEPKKKSETKKKQDKELQIVKYINTSQFCDLGFTFVVPLEYLWSRPILFL